MHLVYFTRPEAHVPRIQNAEIYAGIPVISNDTSHNLWSLHVRIGVVPQIRLATNTPST
jgi:hypothetical protein